MLPGSPKMGRVDVKALSAKSGGSDRLEGAVPVLCEPGDVYIQSRLGLHCAFPNQTAELRATLQWGFFPKASVLGKHTAQAASMQLGKLGGGQKPPMKVYDEAFIEKRSRMVQLAIDARRQRYPLEAPYVYRPFKGREE